ncbi:MAG: ABC transporter substrate-binding protein [Bacteroidota bacterium]
MRTNWITAILGLLMMACYNPQHQEQVDEANSPTETKPSFKPEITHARYFSIDVNENFKTIIVKNPWEEGDTLVSYLLYPKGTEEPTAEWAEFKIPVPIDEVVATSSPHIGFIGLLDELDKITGVADDRYLYNAYISENVKKGKISQVGSLKDSNLEVLLNVSPDLVMKTGVDNVRNEDVRLTEAGIPISYNVEWMETSMLARAEWIKFVGAFFNKDAKADSVFRNVEKEYLKALSVTSNIDNRPSIMTGNNFKGTWYMPSANSYLTKLIYDAGGAYHYKNEKSTGSLPLSFEVVLDDLIEADYWIGPRAESLKELEMMDERYTLFKAFREGNVYTNNNRISENGGNDYWESGMTRPDLILKDVIKIFHPDLLPDHQLYYYKKLQ